MLTTTVCRRSLPYNVMMTKYRKFCGFRNRLYFNLGRAQPPALIFHIDKYT